MPAAIPWREALATANGAAPMRTVPDIAAIADPNTGFLIGQTQTLPEGGQAYGEYRIGGTSLAAPVVAGVQALAQEAHGGRPPGFANPAIYARYVSSSFGGPTHGGSAHGGPTHGGPTHGGPTHGGPTHGGSAHGAKVFHDVTDNPAGGAGLAVARVDFVSGYDTADGLATSVRTLGADSSLHAVRGYDDVTGVGSPAKGYVESYRR